MTTEDAKRLCIVCGRRELDLTAGELQTCVHCLGQCRRDLLAVVDGYALLPLEVWARAGAAAPLDPTGVRGDDEPLPGGDALVLLAGGSTTTVAARPSALNPDGDRSHAADNLDSDTPSVLAVLASWEDDWRSVLGIRAARDAATVSGTSVFLLRGLGYMAQHHPAFDEFASDIAKLRGHVERVTSARDAVEKAAVRCPDCGDRLRKEWAKPDPCDPVWVPPTTGLGYPPYLGYGPYADRPGYWKWCDHASHRHGQDQGGRRDEWKCRNRECGRIVDDASYWLAVRALLEQQQEAS